MTTAAAILAVFSAFFWAQRDDAQAMGNPPSAQAAAEEEAAALNSREWAGRQVCGPHATPNWLDDKTLRCLRNLDDSVSVAEGRP